MDDAEWAQRKDNINKRIAKRQRRSLYVFAAFVAYLIFIVTLQGVLS